jgi:hypothetical protein
VEDFISVDPSATGLNWNDPGECGGSPGDPLEPDIRTWRNNQYTDWYGSSNPEKYLEETDVIQYIGWQGDNDGLDWDGTNNNRNGMTGCTYEMKVDFSGMGWGWTYMRPSFPTIEDFLEYHAILFAHEIGHALGANHNDADESMLPACLGAGTFTYHTIMWTPQPDNPDCYGATPTFSTTNKQNMDKYALDDKPFDHTQPQWSSTDRTTGEAWFIDTWFVQHSSETPLITAGNKFWRVYYKLHYVGQTGFNLYEYFCGVRSGLGVYDDHYDAWLGYMGPRHGPASFVTQPYEIEYESGWARDHWTAPGTLEGYDNNDDKHQVTDKGGSGVGGEWLIFPAYHSQDALTHYDYGPYHWAGITWGQSD